MLSNLVSPWVSVKNGAWVSDSSFCCDNYWVGFLTSFSYTVEFYALGFSSWTFFFFSAASSFLALSFSAFGSEAFFISFAFDDVAFCSDPSAEVSSAAADASAVAYLYSLSKLFSFSSSCCINAFSSGCCLAHSSSKNDGFGFFYCAVEFVFSYFLL